MFAYSHNISIETNWSHTQYPITSPDANTLVLLVYVQYIYIHTLYHYH